MKRLFALSVLLVSLVGCASVEMAKPEQDAAAKKFSAATDKAAVYIYRNESMGAAVTMNVTLDGQAIGQTGAKTYLYKELPEGKHTITSKAENTDSLELDAKPGMLYYVWQEVKLGVLSARSKLHLVSEAEGQKGVQESKLAATK